MLLKHLTRAACCRAWFNAGNVFTANYWLEEIAVLKENARDLPSGDAKLEGEAFDICNAYRENAGLTVGASAHACSSARNHRRPIDG